MTRKHAKTSAAEPAVVPQRWARPEVFHAPPGFWKQQLSGNLLKIATKKDITALKKLLKQLPDALNKRGSHGRTLLWEAVRAGRIDAVQFLIDAGADVNLTGCYNGESFVQLTPVCAARYYKQATIENVLRPISAAQDVFRLAWLGDEKAVQALLDQQPDLVNAEDPHDAIYFVPLIAFAMAGGHATLMQMLIERGAQLAPYSAMLLNMATSAGRIDWIDLLLEGGADIRAVFSGTLLGEFDAVRHLIERGAPVNQAGFNGFTPLIFLARGDKGNRLDLMQLILAHGADVNATGPMNRTALHYAAAAGQAGKIELLLSHGANRTSLDDNGDTPLALAKKANKPEAIALL